MVREYRRISNKGSSYSKETLDEALNNIRRGAVTVYRASKQYGIPKITLYSHLKGKRGVKSKTLGRSTAIPEEHETRLASCLKIMEKWGFGLSRKEVINIVADYVAKNGLITPFKNGIPGEDWFLGFKKRHNLSVKKPQSVEYSRKKMTDPFVISEYFDLLLTCLDELQLHSKPENIWNLDETSLCIDPSKTKVVGQKNSPSSRTTSGPGKENTTVLAACNAAGGKAPPLIIFKGKYVWDQWVAPNGYPGTVYASSINGWIDSDIFLSYFKNSLLPAFGENRPVLLIYDGHKSHVDNRLVEAAVEASVTILKLPPHTSHLLQPLDLCVFRSLKNAWDAKLVQWQRNHHGVKIPKGVFSQLMGETWLNVRPGLIISGFRKAGIHPFDRDVVPRDKYDIGALKRWEDHKRKASEGAEAVPNNRETCAGPSECGTSGLQSPNCTVEDGASFEELLLQTVKQIPQDTGKRRRRVAVGAEVITSVEVALRRQALIEEGCKAKTTRKRKSPANKKQQLQSDSEESAVSIPSSRSPTPDISELQNEIIEEEENERRDTELCSSIVDAGKWVIVKFATKKTCKHYIGRIIVKNEEDCSVVTFARKVASRPTFIWPEIEDICEVSDSDILMVLPEPSIGRRGEFSFGVSFSTFNIN
ncbi:uncharacterized protein [Anabrus simplex]|uniref:uncharacterized protein n=1 Tax=Anabrus simplex TaxID=316456 RepID=UPI0035A37854